MVRNRPNSGSRSTTSPSVKTNCGLRSFLHARMMATCWAATDSTGSSIRLNSSKQPHEPDCARPATRRQIQIQIQIQQLFLLRPLQSDRWRITEVSQHVFHSRRQTEIKMFWGSVCQDNVLLCTLCTFLSHMGTDLRFHNPLPDTARPRIRDYCIPWCGCACLLSRFHWYSFCLLWRDVRAEWTWVVDEVPR